MNYHTKYEQNRNAYADYQNHVKPVLEGLGL